MAGAKRNPRKKKNIPAQEPPPLPSLPPPVPEIDGKGMLARLAVVAVVAALLWWTLSPRSLKGLLQTGAKTSSGSPAPAASDLKGAPNTMQDWVFEFDGVKTKRGSTGWGGVPRKDQGIMGGDLTMNNVVYKTGIGVQAPSEIVFGLNGKYARFSCLAGVDDRGQESTSFFLIVKADGKEIFKSKLLKKGSKPLTIDVPVAGAKELSLIVDPDGDNGWDQAEWVNLKFTKAGS